MLQNDISGMDALDEPIKRAEKDIDDLKLEMYGVMGAFVGSQWGSQPNNDLPDASSDSYLRGMQHAYGNMGDGLQAEQHRTPNRGNMSPAGNTGKQGQITSNGKPLFSANDTPAHVIGLDDEYGSEPKPSPMPPPPPIEDMGDYIDNLDDYTKKHLAWENSTDSLLAGQYAPEKQQRIETLTYKPSAEFVSFITKGLQFTKSEFYQAKRVGDTSVMAQNKENAVIYQTLSDMVLNPSNDNETRYKQMEKGLKAAQSLRDDGGNKKMQGLIQDQIIGINRGMNVVGEAYLDEVDQKLFASNMKASDFKDCKTAYRAYYQSVIDRESLIEIDSRSLKEDNLTMASVATSGDLALLDVLEGQDIPLYSSEKEAVFAFKKEAMPLTLQNDKEYSAVLDSVDVLDTGTGKVQTYYYYLNVKQGAATNVIFNAVLGAGGGEDRRLLHTHPVDGGWNRNFSGDPEDGIFAHNPVGKDLWGKMGDSSVPSWLGYKGIYVVGSGAELKLYESKGKAAIGSGYNTHANTMLEMKYLSTIDLY